MADAGIGFDNAYNRKLRALISDMENMDVITHQPQLLGGGPVRKYILSGDNGSYPPIEMLAELKQMGGAKFNVMKVLKSKPAQAIIKPLTDAVIHEGVRYAVGGKISRSKKAKKWTNYAVDTANKGLDLASRTNQIFGGKISRSKKAKKWTNYAVDTANKGLDLVSRANQMFGYGELEDVARKVVRRGRRIAEDPSVKEEVALLRKTPMARKAVAKAKSIMGSGKPKNARAMIVKQVMAEKGLGLIEASKYVKLHGLY